MVLGPRLAPHTALQGLLRSVRSERPRAASFVPTATEPTMADNEAPHAHDLATDEAKTRGCGVGRQMPSDAPIRSAERFRASGIGRIPSASDRCKEGPAGEGFEGIDQGCLTAKLNDVDRQALPMSLSGCIDELQTFIRRRAGARHPLTICVQPRHRIILERSLQ